MKGWIAARQARWLGMLVLGSLWLLAAAQAAPPPQAGFTPDPAKPMGRMRIYAPSR